MEVQVTVGPLKQIYSLKDARYEPLTTYLRSLSEREAARDLVVELAKKSVNLMKSEEINFIYKCVL